MQADAARPETGRRRARRRSHESWLRDLLLAVSLVVVASSVIGMHQLSVGHEVVTGQTSRHALTGAAADVHHDSTALPLVEPDHSAEQPAAVITGGAVGDPCPDCGEHRAAFGSDLLALTLLVLSWLLAPPRVRHLPPFLLPWPWPRSAPAWAGWCRPCR